MDDNTVTSQKEVVITYETLYELLRREKNREELQGMDQQFFNQLVSYLIEKDHSYKDADIKNDVFSINEKTRLQTELHNIHRLVKELYERREKKVVEMALNRSRTNANIVDTSNLLSEERALFDRLLSTLDSFRHNILGNILQLREPMLSSPPSIPEPPAPIPPTIAKPTEEKPAAPDSKANQKTVRFLQEVPSVVGPELETYGPFNPNDVAKLPIQIADILIEQGAAVEQT